MRKQAPARDWRMLMLRRSIMTALVPVSAFAAAPASACAVHTPVQPAAVRSADLVVVGRIANYRAAAHSARFDVVVGEVLRGRAGRTLAARLDGTMYGAPRSAPRGRVLIAMRIDRGGPVVLQGMCSPPFILEAGSARAQQARRLLLQR